MALACTERRRRLAAAAALARRRGSGRQARVLGAFAEQVGRVRRCWERAGAAGAASAREKLPIDLVVLLGVG